MRVQYAPRNPLFRAPTPLFYMDNDNKKEEEIDKETEKLIDEIISMFEDIAAKTKGK